MSDAGPAIGLDALEARVRDDLRIISYPDGNWVPERRGPDGRPVLDVLVIGGEQGGLAIAHALKRARIDRVRIVDRAPEGLEGPWMTYARMPTLRSPKEVNGPDLDIPSLSFRAWFVAQHGEAEWSALNKIAKEDWASYLLWLRRALDIRIENGISAERISPSDFGDLVAAELVDMASGARESVLARKIVVATGIETPGKWWTPEEVAALDRSYWAHASANIDFESLKGRRVAVLGAGASAFDNAAMALEAGAARVTVCCRREDLQRVQPFKWLSFPGFLGHFAELDDSWRWRFMNHLLTLREAFPRETWERVAKHEAFELLTGAPWLSCRAAGGGVEIETPGQTFEADYLIVGTGFDIDLPALPEFSDIAANAALWRDRFHPPASEENPRLGRYPYLDSTFAFQERVPGTAPWLSHVRLFTFGATVSFGPSGSSINAMKFAVPRLVSGIVRDLFTEDVEQHWDSLKDYNLPEFLLPGENGEAAPQQPVIGRTA
ncbi:NAD(P)/FAD-dependent oxidoreductase [Nisaea acidiphila]|uniref:NAD(P)/FAD-dependent oxidoreductase n=1 Tax=Nisaea acidiphila TaxID=1862145 RepID=A0A9J7ARQ2_9PROT|nr:NAD(P)/FAD-dependent oxidoreductase [Nisaea acidiphila]UUX50040.1 NAD(P)/FAD-dependent oxidoreductase [Nisaea acidiphila]